MLLINFITGFAFFLSCGFFILWLSNKSLRDRIESPKYDFQEKSTSFDKQVSNPELKINGTHHES